MDPQDHSNAPETVDAAPVPTQAHTCTAVIEELVASTAETEWDGVV